MTQKIYNHIGYYNEIEDIKAYGFLTARRIVEVTNEFSHGCWFDATEREEDFTESDLKEKGADFFGKYAIVKTIDGGDIDSQYIDVYEFVREEETEEPLRLNPAGEEETINVWLSKEKTPIAWRAKMDELIEEEGMTEAEAEKFIADSVWVMEIYYEKGQGLFLVETEACECTGTVHSPYSCRPYQDCE